MVVVAVARRSGITTFVLSPPPSPPVLSSVPPEPPPSLLGAAVRAEVVVRARDGVLAGDEVRVYRAGVVLGISVLFIPEPHFFIFRLEINTEHCAGQFRK